MKPKINNVEIIDWGYVSMPPDEIVISVKIGERIYQGCLTEIEEK